MTVPATGKPGGWARARRWTAKGLLGLLALLLILVIAGALYEGWQRHRATQLFQPTGRLIDIGGRRIHIDCRGTGSPTIILESGLGSGGSVDWARVHDALARHSRTCAYDRAGIMWSDPKPGPQNAVAVAEDLHATLAAAEIEGPLVLAGHSIGGPYTRVYTGRYGDQVAGLVMVDPSHPDQVARLGRAIKANVDPTQVAWMVRIANALSWTGIVRLMTGGDVPNMPKDASAKIAAYTSGSIRGAGAELEGFRLTLDQARAVRSFGDRPLIILTAMAPHTPAQLKGLNLTPQVGARMKQAWKTLHTEMVAMSSRGSQQIVPDSGHYIQIDRPDVVIAAVEQVVNAVRADGARQPDRQTGERR
ncbi:alpha/beta hydrolase [Sphingobium lactosutens]|uniref:alpha/beta fold hydrolase n=1 Tax=Sphingobium lactosutens TaxID=522773 RepID=UPI0015BB3FF7|nr:alpha/beta hydrolase [Sphingobium lactosutens]NWK95876.1 alpha/beta hydrolase [Sphingobium lactosutens]